MARTKAKARVKEPLPHPAAVAVAIVVCESKGNWRGARRAPVGVALAASVSFDNEFDDTDDVAPQENMRT